MKKLGMYVATIVVAGALLAVAAIVAVPAMGKVATAGEGSGEPIDLSRFDDYAVRSEVYASDGSLVATLHGVENREPVTLDQVPDPVKNSILAVEDAEFYNHGGVNVRALTRAMVENVQAGGVEQGGSTITQQLVKNALLNDDRVLNRKIKEAALALRLEDQMSKDQILEAYLNTVYFGNGAYGVQAAAETYWGKNVGELGWAEGAMLAAIISNPLAYDPVLHPDVARKQRDVAIDRIVAYGSLDRDQAAYAKLFPVPSGRCTGVAGPRPEDCGEIVQPLPESYVADAVKNELLDLNRHEYDQALGTTYEQRFTSVFRGGLQVHSTIDPVAQASAQDAHDNTLPSSVRAQADAEGVTTASVTVENSTGAIRAMIGGPPWSRENQYNIAITEPGRPTGSTFKTFVLLTALEQGDIPSDTVIGESGCWPPPAGDPLPYCPKGPGGTITSIIQKSSNAGFVRLGQTVGLTNVVDVAERLGVQSEFNPAARSMPLGVFNVTPLEMASAYSAIPNGGVRNPPYLVESIEDRDGNVVFQHTAAPERAVTPTTACYATEVLAANVTGGTGTRAALSGTQAAGKTGTTEANADTWFVGFTTQMTTAVWMGIPGELKSMKNFGGNEQFGGLWPATIWHNINQDYLAQTGFSPAPFAACPDPGRGGRPARGAADPYGTLNGGRVPTYQAPSAGTGGGGGGAAAEGEGGAPTTDTTAPAPTAPTSPPTSAPPAPTAAPAGTPPG